MRLYSFLFLLFLSSTIYSSDLYWINNSGNWSDASHWSLSSGGSSCNCIPGPSDNVRFDANSFTQAGAVVTINQIAVAKDVNWTGVLHSPTLDGNFYGLYIFGSLALNPDMQISYTGDINFFPVGAVTLSTANHNLNNKIVFAGTGSGSITLSDSLKTSSEIQINSGALNTASQYIKAYSLSVIANSGTCNILLGSSVIELLASGSIRALSISGQLLNVNAGTSHFVLKGLYPIINAGRFQLYDVSFTNNTSNGSSTIQSNGTDTSNFHDLIFAGDFLIYGSNNIHDLNIAGGKKGRFADAGTITFSGSIITNGNCNTLTRLSGLFSGGTFLKSSNPITVDHMLLTYLNATPAGIFTATNSADLGNNSGWTFIIPPFNDYYWIGGKGNWHDPAHWSLTSGGSPASCIPFVYDNVHFDSLSFQSPGDSVMITNLNAYCNNAEWNYVKYNPVWNTSYFGVSINGSLDLDSAMMPVAGNLTFIGSGINYIRSEGCNINGTLSISCNGTYALQDSIAGSGLYIYISRGSFDTQSWNIRAMWLYSQGLFKRSLNLGSSEIRITGFSNAFSLKDTGLTIDAGTSIIRMLGTSSGQTLVNQGYQLYDVAGGNLALFLNDTLNSKYHNIYGTAGGVFHGRRTVNNLVVYYGKSYSFHYKSITTFSGTILRAGNSSLPRPTLNGYLLDSTFFFKASGQLCTDSLQLSRIHTTGGASFYVGANSVDNGNNSGWIFQACVPLSVNDMTTPADCITFPVPASDRLYINCESLISENYTILNTAGQIVQEGIQSGNSIDIHKIKSGIYILKLHSREGRNIVMNKFIKD
ncbi:MAG: T9SS type A sorting domain-containing protein [Bacteroidota bacterium]